MSSLKYNLACLGIVSQVLLNCLFLSDNDLIVKPIKRYTDSAVKEEVLHSKEFNEMRDESPTTLKISDEDLICKDPGMAFDKADESLEKILDYEREEIKRIPILLFHDVGCHEKSAYSERYVVSPENFREQLHFLYSKNYVPISIDEYLKDDLSYVPKGKKPVILTFDDATKGQLFYYEDGQVDSRSAVGIMNDFSKKHCDWRKRAVFFIDFVDKDGLFQVPFEQKGKEDDKISYLLEEGYEVNNHTFFHHNIDKITYNDLVNDIKTFNYFMKDFDLKNENTLALPYGSFPGSDKKWQFLDKKFDFYFAAYAKTVDKRAHRVGSKGFDNRYIPRIEVPPDCIPSLKRYIEGY